jgi:nucleoside-diphosphate-sugar epimerase
MKVLVTGNGGYVGSALVPLLLRSGHSVVGYDIVHEYDYDIPNFISYKADIRDIDYLEYAMRGCEAIIHLACISNDPSADLDPALTKTINLDSFLPMVKAAKKIGVRRFIFASSSSVYGVKSEPDVTEDLPLEPLTDYSRYKAKCEEILLNERCDGFETVIIRPATVCGYSSAVRLDLCVHILTMAALTNRVIKVFGGDQ